MNTLVTVPFSHFCEKARWALDWCRVPYKELGVLPGVHRRHTTRAGGRTVPVLLRDGGQPLLDSTDILKWADEQAPAERKLFHAASRAESEQLEDDFDERLGPATRLWAYAYGLRDRPMLRKIVAPSFPKWTDRVILKLALPLMGKLIEREYGVNEANRVKAEETIVGIFATVSARLEKQPYLDGERFGAADLTFAAMGGPMVMPKEHRFLDASVEVPAQMRAFIERLRATRAGQHAARMYREHRG